MLLEARARALANTPGVLGVVPTNDHVDAGGPAEVERCFRVPEDLVEVARHCPAVAMSLEELERERGPAEHVGVERVGPELGRQFCGGDAGATRDGLPDPELARDLDEVCSVVSGDQVVELRDLLRQGWTAIDGRSKSRFGCHEGTSPMPCGPSVAEAPYAR
jgi:hypothetical protein